MNDQIPSYKQLVELIKADPVSQLILARAREHLEPEEAEDVLPKPALPSNHRMSTLDYLFKNNRKKI